MSILSKISELEESGDYRLALILQFCFIEGLINTVYFYQLNEEFDHQNISKKIFSRDKTLLSFIGKSVSSKVSDLRKIKKLTLEQESKLKAYFQARNLVIHELNDIWDQNNLDSFVEDSFWMGVEIMDWSVFLLAYKHYSFLKIAYAEV